MEKEIYEKVAKYYNCEYVGEIAYIIDYNDDLYEVGFYAPNGIYTDLLNKELVK